MDQQLRESVLGISKKSSLTYNRKWPNAVIPYIIDKDFGKILSCICMFFIRFDFSLQNRE